MIQKNNCSVCSPTDITSNFYEYEDSVVTATTEAFVCVRCQRLLEEIKPRKESNMKQYTCYNNVKHHKRSRVIIVKIQQANHIKLTLTPYLPRKNI